LLLPYALSVFAPDVRAMQVAVVWTCVFLMFVFFGASGYFGYGEVSHVLSGLSMIAAPGRLLAALLIIVSLDLTGS
jgi:hypothetical protein